MAWVAATRDGLTPRDKLAQLFVLLERGTPEEVVEKRPQLQAGRHYPHLFAATSWPKSGWRRDLGTLSAVPLLISADLEGSRMSLPFGTTVPNPLGLAAVDDVEATDARFPPSWRAKPMRVGLNWSFTPVIDINAAWRSAIVGTRSYGSDIDRVERHAHGPDRRLPGQWRGRHRQALAGRRL